ncbi:MAG TPA: hypothetical protein VGO94_10510, partial [Mycobacteriales bacterium]|nr:hypothetical protein [Mycobacteriales bacterium]
RSGTPVTGVAADKAEAAALARFSGGTVDRVLQPSDGSYAAEQRRPPGADRVTETRMGLRTGS